MFCHMARYLSSVPYVRLPPCLTGKSPCYILSQSSYLFLEVPPVLSCQLLAGQLFIKPIRRYLRQARKDRDTVWSNNPQHPQQWREYLRNIWLYWPWYLSLP